MESHWRHLRVGRGISLPLLVGVTVLASLAYFPVSRGSVLNDIPEVVVPLVTTCALVLYVIRVGLHGTGSGGSGQIAKYGWVGAVVAVCVSGWWVALSLAREAPVVGLSNEILTVWSLAIGAGVLAGTSVDRSRHAVPQADRSRVLGETTWVNRSDSNPILHAVVDVLAEVEGADPLEMDPLYEQIDPDTFEELRTQEGAQWQFAFYTDDYEIRVSSQGTVTVYESPRIGVIGE